MTPQSRQEKSSHKTIVVLLAVIATILIGQALRATSIVTMPLACAFFIVVLVRPVEQAIRRRVPRPFRWLGIAVTMLMIIGVLTLATGAVALSVNRAASSSPKYVTLLGNYYEQILQWAEKNNIPLRESLVKTGGMRERAVQTITTMFWSTWSALAGLVFILFLVLLMLLEARDWQQKSERAFEENRQEMLEDTVETIADKIRKYLWIRTLMSGISAAAEGGFIWIMGVDFALLWTIVIFILNYIPNVGSIVALVPPAVLGFVQFGWGKGLVIAGGLLVLDMVIGNYIDPRLEGRSLSLSPIVVLLSIVFWGWVWGIVGALLAVPMTVSLVIIFSHVPAVQPLALMLSRTGTMEEINTKKA